MKPTDEAPMSREWNYHPELPLADPSIFRGHPTHAFLSAGSHATG